MKRHLFTTIAVLVVFFGAWFGRIARSSSVSTTHSPTQTDPTTVVATRITNRSAPFIDGGLEAFWQIAGKITFPNAAGSCFNLNNYDGVDPSTFTVYFMHDDRNLYLAVETLNDRMVESSTLESKFDQESDGMAGLAIQRKNDSGNPFSLFRLMWHQDNVGSCDTINTGPLLDRDRMVYDAEWRGALRGSWNNNSDADRGYTFEFSIPLNDTGSESPGIEGPKGLGGWKAGDQMLANIVLVDHDGNPKSRFNDAGTRFGKCWWGDDAAEKFATSRFIKLSNAPPQGDPGDDARVVARRINAAVAPVIDGKLDDPVWQQRFMFRFPNSVGRSFTLSQARYNADDPSSYEVYLLHDDKYLYVAVKSDDKRIEAAGPTSDDDQASDGLPSLVFETKPGTDGKRSDKRYSTFWHKLDEWKPAPNITITDCNGVKKTGVNLHFQQGVPRYPYNTEHVNWAPTIVGTFNNNNDVDGGYAFEYKIPLSELGGYAAGESIPANIVLIDHDSNPNGKFDACETNFKKFWWGFDGNEFYPPDKPGQRRSIKPEEERFVVLGGGPAYGTEPTPLPAATKAAQYLANQQLLYTGLLRSFPDEMAAHTYDNAVALIALADAGKKDEAERLTNALIGLMEVNGDMGFFYDSYNAVDKLVGQGTGAGTGPNTWAAFALAYYGKVYDDRSALEAANKVKQWVMTKLYDSSDGGVWGGICHPFEERDRDHSRDTRHDFKSTEQVLDTWHLLRILEDPRADKLQDWLVSPGRGWVETDPRAGDVCRQDRRFATGVNSCGGQGMRQDLRLYLDPQSWGSIFAVLAREFDKASPALRAAEQHMRITTLVGGQSVTGFGDSCLPKDNIIWYGGTAQMIVAYTYNNDLGSASYYLDQMARVQNPDGSWNHSSESLCSRENKCGKMNGCDQPAPVECGSCDDYESFHIAKPHIGETTWNYFALRNVNDGRRLPYLIGRAVIPSRPPIRRFRVTAQPCLRTCMQTGEKS